MLIGKIFKKDIDLKIEDEIQTMNKKLEINVKELKSVSAVDDKTFREEILKINNQIGFMNSDFENKVKTSQNTVENKISRFVEFDHNELLKDFLKSIERIDHLEASLIKHSDVIGGLQDSGSNQIENVSPTIRIKKELDKISLPQSNLKDPSQIESPLIKLEVIDENMHPKRNSNDFDKNFHDSFEKPVSEEPQTPNIFSTISTNKIATKMEKILGNNFNSSNEEITRLTNVVRKLETMVKLNSEETEILKHKLFIFMRGEKSRLNSQDELATSIKKGIHLFISQNKTNTQLPIFKNKTNVDYTNRTASVSPLRSLQTQVDQVSLNFICL